MKYGRRLREPRDPEPPAPDLEALARDWITLWQSELAAIAADREMQESWQAILALWAGAAGAILAAATPRPNTVRRTRGRRVNSGRTRRGRCSAGGRGRCCCT